MKLEVIHSAWGADGQEYAGGSHEIAAPSRKFLKLVAAAEAVGAVKAHASKEEREMISSALESDADSEKKLAKAVESGEWQKSNLAQYIHDAKARLGTGNESEESQASLKVGLADAERIQARIDTGASYETAVDETRGIS